MNEKTVFRQRRVFSEPLKRHLVKQIETGKVGVKAVAREYDVSESAIYVWLKKYSRSLQPSKTMVVQMESEFFKTKQLEQKVKDLEAALGRKQLEIDFLNKMIEIGKEELGIDLKKKFSTPPFNGTGSTKDSTATK